MTKYAIGGILSLISWFAIDLAIIAGLGYGLYLFSVVGVTIGLAAWSGFVLWGVMTVLGFVGLFIGLLMVNT